MINSQVTLIVRDAIEPFYSTKRKTRRPNVCRQSVNLVYVDLIID